MGSVSGVSMGPRDTLIVYGEGVGRAGGERFELKDAEQSHRRVVGQQVH